MLAVLWLGCTPVTLDAPSVVETGAVEAPTGPCGGLEAESSEVWTQEGDSVRVDVWCATEVAPSVAGLPAGATFDEGDFRWRPDVDQAGEYTVVFSGPSEDGPPETWPLLIHVADGWDEDDNEPVDPMTYLEEYGLPVMHIDPSGSLGEGYTDAVITFEGREYGAASIKKRGAASLGYPKNSFTVEFDPEDQLELSDQGMGDKRHLVLITSFDDNSYVRQELAYGLWADMTEHAGADRMVVRTFPVVVYLDGEYFGLYTASDHVDDEFLGQMGLNRDGELYKAVSHDANFFSTAYGGSAKGTPHQGYEQKEGTDWGPLDDVVNFTGSASSGQIRDTEVLDIPEMMDWLLFVVFTAADDSAGKNSYLAWDAASGQLRFAPWDFNHCWGQDWRTLRVGSSHENRFTNYNRVFQALQEVSGDALQTRWDALLEGPFAEEALLERVDGLYSAVHPSAGRDWDKWGQQYRSYGGWSWRDDWTSYEEEREYLVDWVEDRARWAEDIRF